MEDSTIVNFSATEAWYLNTSIIEDALEFFNLYFKLNKHPFTMEDVFQLGNFQFALKIENIAWRSFEMDEQRYYRVNPLEFWKNLIKSMTQSHYAIFHYYIARVIRCGGMTVLDYGGGSGFLSYLLACHGFDVTFAEVNIVSLSWMRYLRFKRNIKMDIIDLSVEEINRKYDVVICKDVLEHVKDPQSLLRKLEGYTGKQLLMSDPHEVKKDEDWLPMHYVHTQELSAKI